MQEKLDKFHCCNLVFPFHSGMTFHGNGAVAQDTISCGITTKCMMFMMSFALHPITITHVWTTTTMTGV